MSELQALASALRFLSVDAVEKAKSGHPGMPLGMADIATVLWKKYLKHNPKNPYWYNRDRFVISNGHGSMLLYALLHLSGYGVSIDDIKAFRQLHSNTPGHPEYLETPGVETTTGPLGQGLANAVGMALAEQHLAAKFNQPDAKLVDHYTYAFVGDGCLMEGISHEVSSLAGTLKLGKLIAFYDANDISIDGNIEGWFTDKTKMRFESYDWHVIEGIDGHDAEAIEAAILAAQAVTDKPSLLICHTVIGYGSQAAGTASVHGAALGEEDIKQLRLRLNWPHAPFEVPEDIKQAWSHAEAGEAAEESWLTLCDSYEAKYPEAFATFLRAANGDLPDDWEVQSDAFVLECMTNAKPLATRKASQQCLNAYAPHLPELMGGSADLTESNNTNWSASSALTSASYAGNYIHYGVREFGMSAIMNGLALHGGIKPFGGTFLVFSDYAKAAVRLAALMKIQVMFVYTHDSIGLGEDGPTHQPVEQLSTLRLTPGLTVWRPADLTETAVAWQQAITHTTGPSCLALSRQALPALPHTKHQVENIKRGGYILQESHPGETPDVILLATGSEVQLALEALKALCADDTALRIRVVSMPCAERFLSQPDEYRLHVMPPEVERCVAIEAGATAYWYQFVGKKGVVIGLDSFGLSAPARAVFEAVGITTQRIIKAVQSFLLEKCVS